MNTTNTSTTRFFFFLGGADAEMKEIAVVLTTACASFKDAGLGWGAKASAYGTAIAEVAEAGFTPVLVELEVDCPVPESTVVVDHHNERAGEPASLIQVLALLGQEPNRWQTLIAANDAGWFPGMVTIGATAEEMAAVRAADPEDLEAERALSAPLETIGAVRVIRMAHSKTAPVGDRLAVEAIAAGKVIPAYIVLSGDGEVNFSGPGDIAQALKEKFGGWAGGAGLGKADGTAFWGGYPSHADVEAFLRERLTK